MNVSACVFNSLRQSIWVFLCCQIWWFGGNFQPWIQSIPVRHSKPAASGMKHSAFIFNDINLSTGTISGCWLRFDSMFPCFTWGTHAHVFSSPCHFHTPLFLPHLHADNNQQLPDSAVQSVPHFLTLTAQTMRRWCWKYSEVSGGVFYILQEDTKLIKQVPKKWWLYSYRKAFLVKEKSVIIWDEITGMYCFILQNGVLTGKRHQLMKNNWSLIIVAVGAQLFILSVSPLLDSW